MSLSMRALQRHGLRPALLLIALVLLREPVLAANPNNEDQNKLASLQHKIDELNQAGKYGDAIPLAEERVKLVEKSLGREHLDTAVAVNALATLYAHTGNYTKAEPLLRRGLEIREKALGPEHPDAAKSLSNLASLHVMMGDYAKAEPLYQRALKI